jgi:hypothetical protein
MPSHPRRHEGSNFKGHSQRLILSNYLGRKLSLRGTYCLRYKLLFIYLQQNILYQQCFAMSINYFALNEDPSTFTEGPIVVVTVMFFM